ncbi:unnamed protein product [Mytilus edulis]|uniref:Uncharacterized protein n=1 Tax=Mytilus edulis TaxID=6550 RepID=A0A8S3TAQ0_MYTED|nr:unnamed protein product [Mytilus edulis]
MTKSLIAGYWSCMWILRPMLVGEEELLPIDILNKIKEEIRKSNAMVLELVDGAIQQLHKEKLPAGAFKHGSIAYEYSSYKKATTLPVEHSCFVFSIDCTQTKKEYFSETSDSGATLDQTYSNPVVRTIMAQELILISKDRYDRLMKQTSLSDNNGTDGGKKVEHDDNKKEEEKTVKTFSPMIEFIYSIKDGKNKKRGREEEEEEDGEEEKENKKKMKKCDEHFKNISPMSWGEISSQIDNLKKIKLEMVESNTRIVNLIEGTITQLRKEKPRRVLFSNIL